MNALTRYLSIGLIVISAAAGGFWFGHHSSAGDPEADDSATTQPSEEDKPVAEVRVGAGVDRHHFANNHRVRQRDRTGGECVGSFGAL